MMDSIMQVSAFFKLRIFTYLGHQILVQESEHEGNKSNPKNIVESFLSLLNYYGR